MEIVGKDILFLKLMQLDESARLEMSLIVSVWFP